MIGHKRVIATDMELPPDLVGRVTNAPEFEVLRLDDVPPARRKEVEVLVLLSSSLIKRELFRRFPRVKVIQSMSAGVDFIDFTSIPKNVTLCSNGGAYKEPIAEHVFAMILFFSKHLARNYARLRQGKMVISKDSIYLAGKTIGVVGAGGIGQSVARVAKAFNMRTLGINTNGRPAPYFDKVWRMDRLDELLGRSDVVVLAIPLSLHTRNLIDAKKLKLMKENAILVNVARGPIVSQADLYAHLKGNPSFKAGIDVWWSYPRKGERFSLEFPFLKLPNFLGSPHNADGVPEALAEGQVHAMENVLHFVRREPLERVIDRSNYKGFSGANHP